MDSVFLIELLIALFGVTVLGVVTMRDLIAHYPIYPDPSLHCDDQEGSDAE